MRTFIIILGLVVVFVIVYFVWSDYRSRKETEKIAQYTAPSQPGKVKKNTALDWVNSLLPVITGTIDTIISKPKAPEEEVQDQTGPPTYDQWIESQNIQDIG